MANVLAAELARRAARLDPANFSVRDGLAEDEPACLREFAFPATVTDHGHIHVLPRGHLDVDTARVLMRDRMLAYIGLDAPEHVLLAAASAGVGKTRGATWLCGELAQRGLKVAYLAPRHDMFGTLLEEARSLGLPDGMFFHWLPKQLGDEESGTPETCRLAPQIGEWTQRRNEPIHFCLGVRGCGADFVRSGCVWHGQRTAFKKSGAAVLVLQHQHLTLGHPLSGDVDVVIGDENPGQVLRDLISVPADKIVPSGVRGDLRLLLRALRDLAQAGQRLRGRPLVDALTGALGWSSRDVADVLAEVPPVGTPKIRPPDVGDPDDVMHSDYDYLPELALHLGREAAAHAASTADYVDRVLVDQTEAGPCLRVVHRHRIAWRPPDAPEGTHGWPRHTIWLDATATAPDGDTTYYERVFGRPVELLRLAVPSQARVHQYVERAHTLGSVQETDESKPDYPLTAVGQQVVAKAEAIAVAAKMEGKTVGVIAFKFMADLDRVKAIASPHPETGAPLVAHFGGSRGSNRFVGVDVLLVIGTFQPPPDEIHAEAKVLEPDRMEPWPQAGGNLVRKIDRRYYNFSDVDDEGQQFGVYHTRVADYDDPLLAAILWQKRDAEIVQAVNRARGVLRPVDVYLFSSHPVDDVPPDELCHMAPEHADRDTWIKVEKVARAREAAGEALLADHLIEGAGVSRSTALRCMQRLVDESRGAWRYPDKGEVLFPGRRGRPPVAIVPLDRSRK